MGGLGWKKEKADTRDQPYGALGMASSLPAAVSLRPYVADVFDQLDTNSCVAQSVAQAVRMSFAYRGLDADTLSRLFLYFNARAWHGDHHLDIGTYIRTCIKGLARFGAPPEREWPFSVAHVNDQPAWNAFREAHDFKGLRGYFRIFDDDEVISQVRAALAMGKPVVSGWHVDESILDADGGSVIDVPTGEIIGGHAMAIIGYDADGYFELVNSWGTGWRDGGFAKCTPDFVLAGQDRWVVDVL